MAAPPIGTILDYRTNAAHRDHIHVEPPKKRRGTPPHSNPGMSPGVKVIYDAMTEKFGRGEYFLDKNGRYVGNDPGVGWTHMGGWNRRPIAGSSSWSQHAYWNALDIGPYINEDQKKFHDFLTGEDDDMAFSPAQEKFLKELADEGLKQGSNGTDFVKAFLKLWRALRDQVFGS